LHSNKNLYLGYDPRDLKVGNPVDVKFEAFVITRQARPDTIRRASQQPLFVLQSDNL